MSVGRDRRLHDLLEPIALPRIDDRTDARLGIRTAAEVESAHPRTECLRELDGDVCVDEQPVGGRACAPAVAHLREQGLIGR